MKTKTNWQITRILAALFIVLAGCKPMSIGVKGDDCLMNGGFEILKKGLPVNWRYYAPETVPNSDFEITSDTSQFREGKRSLKFEVRKCDAIGGCKSPGFFGSFKVVPNETYRISFWLINKGCRFKVYLESSMKGNAGPSETVLRTKDTIPEWTYYEFDFKIPATIDMLRFELNILSPGTIWIDDIIINGTTIDKSERTMYPFRGYQECK